MTANNQLRGELGEVEKLIGPSVEAMGFRLVRLALMGEASSLTLQVMAEPLDDSEMNVDQCADISQRISAILDVEDPIPSSYALEVSSPGVERPLVRQADFSRFVGHEVRIEAVEIESGQNSVVGQLLGLNDDRVMLSVAVGGNNTEELEIPYDNISQANLTLADQLIQDTLKKRKS